MNLNEIREYCLSFPNAIECFPFDNKTLVFKVNNKMFALVDTIKFESINLKCNPEKCLILREKFIDVLPGFHMNKNHWNTVLINKSVSDIILKEWILESYNLVIKKSK